MYSNMFLKGIRGISFTGSKQSYFKAVTSPHLRRAARTFPETCRRYLHCEILDHTFRLSSERVGCTERCGTRSSGAEKKPWLNQLDSVSVMCDLCALAYALIISQPWFQRSVETLMVIHE